MKNAVAIRNNELASLRQLMRDPGPNARDGRGNCQQLRGREFPDGRQADPRFRHRRIPCRCLAHFRGGAWAVVFSLDVFALLRRMELAVESLGF